MSPSRPFGRGGLNFFPLFLKTTPSFVDFSHLSLAQWAVAAVAALCVGISKSGFGGMGMLTVTLMAAIMPGQERESTGVVLPLLICGDLFAVAVYRRHANWGHLVGLLPPAVVGVVAGYFWLQALEKVDFRPIIGGIILALVGLQVLRQWRATPGDKIPHGKPFIWGTGFTAGVTTMLANAAGPVMTLYFLAVRLPKMELVGTAAWYFLIVNLLKVPFSSHLGFITPASLWFNLLLVPFVGVGILGGRWLLHRIDQRRFERLLLVLIVLSAAHLLFS